MGDYLRRGQSALHVVRLRLAEILIRIEDRPGQALVVLSKLSGAALNEKQQQKFARLKQQAEKMKEMCIFEEAHTEIGHIIVTSVDVDCVKGLVDPDSGELQKLIAKQ